MLLRWLVNQYLQDAVQGKAREVLGEVLRGERPLTASESPSTTTESSAPEVRTPNPEPSERLPCDVVFVFALGIESGGLVDLLQGTETSRHIHGTERGG